MALTLIYSLRSLVHADDEDSITMSALVEIVMQCLLISHFFIMQDLLNPPKNLEAQKKKPTLLERIVHGLVIACKEGPLPAPTFAFVFPVSWIIQQYSACSINSTDVLAICL